MEGERKGVTMEEIFHSAKEVCETKDHKEAARLLQSENWVTVRACVQGDDVLWIMIRIR